MKDRPILYGSESDQKVSGETGAVHPGLGVPHIKIDAAGAWVVWAADEFGRTTCTTRAYEASVSIPTAADACALDWTTRVSWKDGVPYVPSDLSSWGERVERRDGQGNDFSVYSYLDGLGREVREDVETLRRNAAGVEVPDRSIRLTGYDRLGRRSAQRIATFSGEPTPTPRSWVFDEKNRPLFSEAPDGGVLEWTYSPLGVRYINADGDTRDVERNGQGEIIQVVRWLDHGGPEEESLITNYLRDPLGRELGTCNSVAVAAGNCPQVTCANNACVVTGGDARHSSWIRLNSLGRKIELHDPVLSDLTYEYNGRGSVVRVQSDSGTDLRRVYDSLGRFRCETEDPSGSCEEVDGARSRFWYGDELGLPAEAHAAGRMARIRTATAVVDLEYDAGGWVRRRVVQDRDRGTSYELEKSFDWQGRLLATEYPDGELVEERYDIAGIDWIGSASRTYVRDVAHDPHGRPIYIEFGNDTTRAMEYLPGNARLGRLTDKLQSGTKFVDLTFSYHKENRLSEISDALDTAESLTNVTYDDLGRFKSATRNQIDLTADYDALGNLTSRNGASIPYEHAGNPYVPYDASDPSWRGYDPLTGNLTVRDGESLTYDDQGRLTAISGPLTLSFDYGEGGTVLRRTRGADESFFVENYESVNGIRAVKYLTLQGIAVARVETVPGTQGAKQPVSFIRPFPFPQQVAVAHAALLVLFVSLTVLARKKQGLPITRAAVASAVAVALAALPSLSRAAGDPASGDLNGDARLDGADGLLAMELVRDAGSTGPSVLEAGDVAPLQTSDGIYDVSDALLILRALSVPDLDGDGLPNNSELALGFNSSPFRADTDGDGLLDQEELASGTNPRLADTDLDGISDHDEIAGGTNPLDADHDDDGLVDGRDPDPHSASPGSVYWVHTDHLGGWRALTDALGSVARETAYGIWGNVRADMSSTSPPAPQPEGGATGQRRLEGTDLLGYSARFYDPATGRFIQPDSLVATPFNPANLNRYSYVLNDPLNRRDPTGRFWESGPFGGGFSNSIQPFHNPDLFLYGAQGFAGFHSQLMNAHAHAHANFIRDLLARASGNNQRVQVDPGEDPQVTSGEAGNVGSVAIPTEVLEREDVEFSLVLTFALTKHPELFSRSPLIEFVPDEDLPEGVNGQTDVNGDIFLRRGNNHLDHTLLHELVHSSDGEWWGVRIPALDDLLGGALGVHTQVYDRSWALRYEYWAWRRENFGN